MAKAQNEIIAESLENIKTDIQDELKSLGIDYTKQLSNSLEVKATAFGAVLSALEYLPTSYDSTGRGPGRNPFIDPDWLRAKGIQPRDLKTGRFITFKSAAILISRKIGRIGTDRFLNRRPGVNIDGILKEHKPPMINKLQKSFASKFREDIRQTIIN